MVVGSVTPAVTVVAGSVTTGGTSVVVTGDVVVATTVVVTAVVVVAGGGRLRRSGGGFGGSRALGGLTAERGFFGCETATRLGSELRLAARFLGAHRRKLRLHRREEAAALREHRSDLHLLVRELLHGRGATVFALLQCSSRRSKLVAHLRRLLRELSIRRRNRPCRLQPIDQVTQARAAEDDVDRGRLVALVDRHEP